MKKMGERVRRINKRGQQMMGLPFSVIFSLVLIIVFIIIAFIAIRHFLDLGKCTGVGQFYDNFQQEIDRVWVSQQSTNDFKVDLPSGITKICFANFSALITKSADYEIIKDYEVYDANVFLFPRGKSCDMPYKLINHLDITKTTMNGNPHCIDLDSGFSDSSVVLKLEKEFYQKYVSVS